MLMALTRIVEERVESSPRPVLIWSTGREPFRFEGEFAD
jgi:hypothetical protein